MKNKEEINVQISAGRGPAECMWVVAQLLKVFLENARKTSVMAEVISRNTGSEPRTLASATVSLKGENALSFLDDWQGSILWIGQSPYRKFHKRKNWFVDLSAFSTKGHQSLQTSDVKFQTFRGSGPGGQAVNKLETAVRAIHIPTGLFATAQESRSQLENKKLALKRLEEIIKEHNLKLASAQSQEQWLAHTSLQRGNPKRVYEGPKFRLKKVN
jgi:peptide chain release factor